MLEPNKYTKCIDSIAPTSVVVFEAGETSATLVGTGIKKREWRWMRLLLHVGQISGNKQLTLTLQHSDDDGFTDPYVDVPDGPELDKLAAGNADGAKPSEFGVYLPTTPWKHWLRPKVVVTGASGEAHFFAQSYLMHPTRSGFADQIPEYSNSDAQNTGGGGGGDQGTDPGGGGGGPPDDPAVAGFFGPDPFGIPLGFVGGGGPPGGGDEEGWFEPAQQVGDLIYYFSDSDGADGDNGLTEGTAKQTVSAAFALMTDAGGTIGTDGSAHHFLFKCGDTWGSALPDMPENSGRSATEPIVLGSYGTGLRPIFSCGSSDGIYLGFSGGAERRCENIAILDIHLSASGGAAGGFKILGTTTNLRIEGCQVSSFGSCGIEASAFGGSGHTNLVIRRNNILDSTSHGMLVSDCTGLTIEENLLDNNGAAGGQYARNVYLDNGQTEIVFRGNTVVGNDGVHLRSGGDASFNLIMRCSHGLQFGAGSQSIQNPAGVTGSCEYNGIFFDTSVDANHLGWGMSIGNVHDVLFYRNVIARNTSTSGFPLLLNYRNPNGLADIGLVNVTMRECIVSDWYGSVINYNQSASPWSNVVFEDCDFQFAALPGQPIISLNGLTQAKLDATHCGGNRYFRTGAGAGTAGIFWDTNGNNRTFALFCADVSGLAPAANDATSTYEQVAYSDPARDLGSYHNTLGGAPTHAGFMAAARLQSKQNWNPDLMARAALTYIFAGYGITIPEE